MPNIADLGAFFETIKQVSENDFGFVAKVDLALAQAP